MNPIEQEVREMLRTKVSQAPVCEEPPTSVIRKTRTLRSVNAIGAAATAAAVVLGIVIGVQSLGDRRVVEPLGQVPWIDVPEGVPAERDLPECNTAQVSVTRSTAIGGDQLDFGLKGDQPCQLWPVLKLGIRDAQGREVISVIGGSGYTTYLDPGVRVPFGITSLGRCGPELSELTYIVTMQESKGRLTVPPKAVSVKPSGAPAAPACTDASPARLHFVVMQPLVSGKPSLPDGLEYSMIAPAVAERGGVLRYDVTIANPTARDVALDPCPAYRQVLLGVEDSRSNSYMLNCVGANGSIPAGGRVTFQMQMSLDRAAAGDWVLTWAVDDVDSYLRASVRIF